MIVCGWCGRHTANTDRCTSCGHPDPELPFVQRGEVAPRVPAGRPTADKALIRRRLGEARAAGAVTVEAQAEYLDVSPRTVRRWRQLS